mgnify:CR=1 FL=1
MSKLYLFGIGGTGARVIRSLTMLLASGVDAGVDTVIPVLIDPDASNGDLTRTVNLLKKYKSIRSRLTFGSEIKSRYFKTIIDDQNTDFRLPIANVGNKTFGQYVEFDNLSRENKAMMSLLFSDKNLNAQMQEGFKGNPNMGSIVLNKFCEPENNVLSNLLQNFADGDKIFIISSIFGGTGAAGFPLLLKTFRQAQSFNSFANPATIANAPIGAISVLPYFGLKADAESEINMATFVSKAKSALTYYQKNLDTDALYYIADDMSSMYENVEGSDNQKNDAHFIEMASALAVVDFAKDNNIRRGSNLYKEFATEKLSGNMNLSSLSPSTRQELALPLISFYIFSQFYKHHLDDTFDLAWAKARNFGTDMLSEGYYRDLGSFLSSFMDGWNNQSKEKGWLVEMAGNSRAFGPFNINGYKNIFHSINGYEPKQVGFLGKMFGNKDGYVLIDDEIAKSSNKFDKRMSDEDYFMNVHWIAIDSAVSKRLNLV